MRQGQQSAETAELSAEDQASTWMEPVPARRRRMYAAIGFPTTAALSLGLAWVLHRNGGLLQIGLIWAVVILFVGGWITWQLFALQEVRRYESMAVPLSIGRRLRKSSPFLVLGIAGPALIWAMQLDRGFLKAEWPIATPFLLPAIVGAFVFFRSRTESVLTPSAIRAKAHFEAPGNAPRSPFVDAFNAKAAALFDHWAIRYPVAVGVFWLAYFVSQSGEGWRTVVASLALGIWGLLLTRELSLWVFGIALVGGIGWALVAGIASLPVSAAIVIGALIIASAIRR